MGATHLHEAGDVRPGLRRNLKTITRSLDAMGVRRRVFLLPAILGIIGTVSRLTSFALLIPLIRLVIVGEASGGRLDALGFQLDRAGGAAETFVFLVAGILLATLIRGAAAYWSKLLLAQLYADTEARLGEIVLRNHLRFDQRYYDTTSLTSSIKKISNLPSKSVKALSFVDRSLKSVLSFALYLAALLFLSWPLALAALAVLGLYFYAFGRMVEKIEDLSELEEEADEQRSQMAHELIQNLPLIKVLGTADSEVEDFRAVAESGARLRLGKRRVLELVAPLKDFLNVVVIVGFVACCSWLISGANEGAVSTFLVFFLVFRRAMTKFSGVLNIPAGLAKTAHGLLVLGTVVERDASLEVPTGSTSLDRIETGVRTRGLEF